MSSSTAQLRFAVEFATFLVAVAGASIVLLRPAVVGAESRTRLALVAGFSAGATGAFLHGSLLLGANAPLVVALRAVAIVLLGIGNLSWRQDPSARRVLWAALAILAVAEAAAGLGAEGVAEWSRAVAAVGLGAVILTSGRRSISTRVATSAAASLLVVVLAVSVALSVVITDNVQHEAFRRLDARARTESEQIDSARDEAVKSARLVALSVTGPHNDLLLALSAQPTPDDTILEELTKLSRSGLLVSSGPILYVTGGRAVIAAVGIDQAEAIVLAGSRAVNDVVVARTESSSSVEVVGNRALAVGVFQVLARAADGQRFVGAVVATTLLDDNYLNVRAQTDPDLSLAVVDRDRQLSVFAHHQLPEPEVRSVGRQALATRGKASMVVRGAFLSARPVLAPDGSAVLAVVGSTPSTLVATTRNSLFRTLFLVALATALLAFLLALVVGERIGAGLRRLTIAAEGIRRGDLTVRVNSASPDEVGVLGAAFDSMAGSIESLAAELRQTADDEAQLRDRLEAVVGGMGEALVAVDSKGVISIFNSAAEDLFGFRADEAVGTPVLSVVHLVKEGLDLSARLTIPAQRSWDEPSAMAIRSDGVQVPVAISGAGLRGPEGELAGAVFVVRDMRREREVEKMKTEFLSNISHELNTPLTPIKGYAEMLRSRAVPPEQTREFLDGILDSADRLERKIDQLVGFAALEAGRVNLRSDPVEPGRLLDAVVARWTAKVDKAHPITETVEADLPAVLGDRRLLERCLDALLDNAIKYSPGGGPVVAKAVLKADAVLGGGPMVELSISDEGVGIPAERVDRIFDEFTQVDGSATRSFEGFGLGLAFVHRIVRAHAGRLECRSSAGQGSTFAIVLPAAPASDQVTNGALR